MNRRHLSSRVVARRRHVHVHRLSWPSLRSPRSGWYAAYSSWRSLGNPSLPVRDDMTENLQFTHPIRISAVWLRSFLALSVVNQRNIPRSVSPNSWSLLVPTERREGIATGSVCLSVYLFVCIQLDSVQNVWNLVIKFGTDNKQPGAVALLSPARSHDYKIDTPGLYFLRAFL